MNRFVFGQKVHINSLDLNGKIVSWEQKFVNGYDCGYTYAVETIVNGSPFLAMDVKEKDIAPIDHWTTIIEGAEEDLSEYGCEDINCRDCCGHNVCDDSDYKNNKESENLDNDKKFNLDDLYDPDEDEKEMIEEIAYNRYIQYESRKLAWEKYKVPMGWKE